MNTRRIRKLLSIVLVICLLNATSVPLFAMGNQVSQSSALPLTNTMSQQPQVINSESFDIDWVVENDESTDNQNTAVEMPLLAPQPDAADQPEPVQTAVEKESAPAQPNAEEQPAPATETTAAAIDLPLKQPTRDSGTIQEGAFIYNILNGSFVELITYLGNDSSVVIPDEVFGYKVQRIAANVFNDNQTLTDITFSQYTESIGESAFQNCDSITTINFNDGLTLIEGSAFKGCDALATVTFPDGLIEIGNSAFERCPSLTSLALPDSITILGNQVFSDCTALSQINYPKNLSVVRQVHDYGYSSLFNNCVNLTTITVPEGVTAIPDYTFANASSSYHNDYSYLETINLPSTLEAIGSKAFQDCRLLGQVDLSDRITEIGEAAFKGCIALQNVELSNDLQSLGGSAFDGCTALTTAVLPNGITTMGGAVFKDCVALTTVNYPRFLVNYTSSNGMFIGCSSLTSIEIPDGVTVLPRGVFSGSSYLQSVTLPDGLQEIGTIAFRDCESISTIVLPDSVTRWGQKAFEGCTALQSINYPISLTTVDQYLGMSNVFYECPNLKSMTIPEGVTALPDYTFATGYAAFESITLPSTLQTIGKNAFKGCGNITALTIPTGVTSIGSRAFNGCASLQTINLPEGVTNLGERAFEGCLALSEATLANSITTMGGWVFKDCSNLTTVNYPTQLTTYTGGQGMFVGCSSLENIAVPAGVTAIPNNVFKNCTYLKSISLPDGLQSIGSSVFSGCSALTALALPDSVTTLGKSVFYNCSALETLNYPLNLTTVPRYANMFDECSSLKTIVVPEGVTAIPPYTFSGNAYKQSYIETISLPSTLQTVGKYAFNYCRNLKDINLPDGITDIGESAFYSCNSLVQLELPDSLTALERYVFAKCANLEWVQLKPALTTIGNYAFSDCPLLKGVWVDPATTSISANSFVDCPQLTLHGIAGSYVNQYANDHNIPFSTDPLPMNSYTNASGSIVDQNGDPVADVSVCIWNTTKNQLEETVYSDANGNWSSQNLVVGDGYRIRYYHPYYQLNNPVYHDVVQSGVTIAQQTAVMPYDYATLTTPASDFSYQQLNGLNARITAYNGTDTAVKIPAYINGLEVTEIANGLFRYNDTIEYVAFPPTLTRIESATFYDRTTLKGVSLPHQLRTIGSSAFYRCTQLTDVRFNNGLETIESSAFSGCTSLQTLDFPDSLTTLGVRVFYNCTSISELNYPFSLTSVGSDDGNASAFYNCNIRHIDIPEGVTAIPNGAFTPSNLETVNLPSTLQKIGDYAFKGCTNLNYVDFPAAVTEIGYAAFEDCSQLQTLDLPDNLTTLGGRAFKGCSQLQAIDLSEGITSVGAYLFEDCNSLTEVNLPNSITTMGQAIFKNCLNLTLVNYPSQLTNYGSNSEGMFVGCSSLQNVAVPAGVTTLPDGVFADCAYLQSVTLPDGLQTIGMRAFKGCSSLASLDLPDSVTTLGWFAFAGCNSLADINYPLNLTSSAGDLFGDCSQLKDIDVPEGVTMIPDNMFGISASVYGQSYIEHIRLPSTLQTIGNAAFRSCQNLKAINLPEGLTAIGESAFEDCNSLVRIETPHSLTSMPEKAFYSCARLKWVQLKPELTTIGVNAFADCPLLKGVWVDPQTNIIDATSFSDCPQLTLHGIAGSYVNQYADTYSIPFSTDPLPTFSYTDASGRLVDENGNPLVGVSVSIWNASQNQLKEIVYSDATGHWTSQDLVVGQHYRIRYFQPEHRFNNPVYQDIVEADGVQLGEQIGIKYYDYAAITTPASDFSYQPIDALTARITGYSGSAATVKIPDQIDGYKVVELAAGVFRNNATLERVALPQYLRKIGGTAFYDCDNLVGVALPHTLETIGEFAFGYCPQLAEINFNNGLTTIERKAFIDCTALPSLDFPDSVATLGLQAFSGCTGIQQVNYPLNLTTVDSYHDYSQVFYECNIETLTVPEGVTTIPAYAFSESNIATLELPSTLQVIGGAAFKGCQNLDGVVLPNGLTDIGDSAFRNCTALSSIELPDGVSRVNASTFEGCESLTEVVLPDSITYLGNRAFKDCSTLKTINYPPNLSDSGVSVFAGCIQLLTLSIPDNITEIPDNLFSNAKYFRFIKLPSSLNEIKDNAFSGCEGLTNVVVPETVTRIGEDAFNGCLNLKSISISPQVTTIGDAAFDNCPKLSIISFMRSYATIYAIDNDIPWIAGPSEAMPERFIDHNQSLYFCNTTELSAAGTINFNLNYQFLENVQNDISNIRLEVKVPVAASLIVGSIRLNGGIVNDFEIEDGVLSIPLNDMSGSLTFSVIPTRYVNVMSYANIKFDNVGVADSEIVGVINESFPTLSVMTADTTDNATVEVVGLAPPLTDVTLLIDGQPSSAFVTTSNRAGGYWTSLTIDQPEEYKKYTLKAQCNHNGQAVETEAEFTYCSTEPALKGFEMFYDGQNLDLFEATDVRPTAIFNPHTYPEFRFEVEASNTDNIEKIYICSERSNGVKRMEAVWVPSLGEYVAEGHFDPNDLDYVPGELSVEFVRTHAPLDFTNQPDLADAQHVNMLPEALQGVIENVAQNVSYTVTEQNGTQTIQGDMYIPASQARVGYEISESPIPEGLTVQNVLSQGYEAVTDAVGNSQYIKIIQGDQEAIRTEVIDFATGKVTEMAVNVIESVIKVSLSDIMGFADTYMTYQDNVVKFEDLKQKIMESDMSPSDKQFTLEHIGRSEEVNQMALIAGGIGTVLLIAGAPVIATGFAVISTALFAMVAFDNFLFAELGIDRFRGITAYPRWLIDPSGYVYAGVTNNRLPGITTTAYWKETADATPVFWNALEWSQYNPLTTDDYGRYAWDVPEGLWQVKYEKAGYQTAYSDWLPVPPPQTNVNINMLSTEKPNLTDIDVTAQQITIVFDKYVDPTSMTATNVILTNDEGNQVAYTISYDNSETAEDGTVYAKTYQLNAIANNSFDSTKRYTVAINDVLSYAGVSSGNQTVTSGLLYGDFTGNGVINSSDVLWLRRYLALGQDLAALKATYSNAIDMQFIVEAADFTANGNVNGSDVLWLRRYLAVGQDVDLLISQYETDGMSFDHLR